MEIEALLEALQDFEKRGKKDTCPLLEHFLCHIAKTGQPMIPWSNFKTYFIFKLEKVMDDFHASAPQKRGQHNPNVDDVPFEDMKARILRIVDGYSGIPFTIQRLCELLIDPKRNYKGTDKFLLGLEKNVMVVSCVYSTSEKIGPSNVNRMNGVMFPSNPSLYSDSGNVNGPGASKPLYRLKLPSCDSFSTNGLPDCPVSKHPEPSTEEVKEHFISNSSPSQGEITHSSGMKNKQPGEDCDDDKPEVKRLKFDENSETESEDKHSTCCKESENRESSQDPSGQGYKSGTGDTLLSVAHEPSSTKTGPSKGEEDLCETHLQRLQSESSVDQNEQPALSEKQISGSDGDGQHSDKQVLSCCNSSQLSTEGDAKDSNSTKAAENN